ncbi:MAG: DUF106 domain-containing protein [Nanoarchaeota archaeon]|nr:DUF106 domain-containing protein [Nanoarchaeota archaeon]
MMDKNMQYMKHSFKPTLYTFIPIIIIFGWLNAHMAYLPITPGSEFQISAEFKQGTFGEVSLEVIPDLEFLSTSVQTIENNAAFWTLKGGEGEYLMKFMFSNREFEKDLFITEENSYATPVKIIKDSDLVKILIHNKKVKPLENFGIGLSWIWTYIILSVIFSIILRKILKIS